MPDKDPTNNPDAQAQAAAIAALRAETRERSAQIVGDALQTAVSSEAPASATADPVASPTIDAKVDTRRARTPRGRAGAAGGGALARAQARSARRNARLAAQPQSSSQPPVAQTPDQEDPLLDELMAHASAEAAKASNSPDPIPTHVEAQPGKELLLPENNEPVEYVDDQGKTWFVARHGDQYCYSVNMLDALLMEGALCSEPEMRSLMQGWTRKEGMTPAAPVFQETVPASPEQYDKIETGQVWTRETSVDGKSVIETITILGMSTGGIIILERKINGEVFVLGDRDRELEELQKELREGNYQLASGSESGVPTPEPLSTPETPPTPESIESPALGEAIAQAQKAVKEKRTDFVRLEAEQKGAWTKLMNFFRTSVGQESDMSPEVSEALEQYKGALTQLLSLEIEQLKHSKLKGEDLRQAMAGLVREFDFVHGEEEDEERRKVRLGEGGAQTLKEKWGRVWTQAKMASTTGYEADGLRLMGAFLEASGATAYRAGIQYNRLTDTKGKKIAMAVAGGALAGAVIFSGGGAAAATAGFLLGAKRLGAAAGAAVAVKGMGDAWAQAGRKRGASERAEKAMSKLKITGADEVKAWLGTRDKSERVPATLSEEKRHEFEQWLKLSTIDNLAKRGAKRRMGRLWRNTAAVGAGGILALAAPGALAHATEAMPAAPLVEGGAVAPTVVEQGASSPSPASARVTEVASAPADTASVPELANRAPMTTADITPPPGATTPSPAPEGPTPSPGVTEKLSTLLESRTIEKGDTIWKYALATGQQAGLNDVTQARFASLLREAINEKLATLSPADAKAAGFVPGPDGKLSADFIRAHDQLDLSKLFSKAELSNIVEQAEAPVEAEAGAGRALERSSQEIAPRRVVDTSLADTAARAPSGYSADIALEEAARVAREGLTTPTPQAVALAEVPKTRDILGEFITERGLDDRESRVRLDAAMAEYVRGLSGEQQAALFGDTKKELNQLFKTSFFSLSDTAPRSELLKASVQQVLEDQRVLDNGGVVVADTEQRSVSRNPLDSTQMERVARFVRKVGRVLGADIAKPLDGENIREYVSRVKIFAHTQGKSDIL